MTKEEEDKEKEKEHTPKPIKDPFIGGFVDWEGDGDFYEPYRNP